MIGHFPDLPNEDYHAADGTSKSKLDAIHVSPLNYWDKYVNPDREPQEDKHCFLIGGATHALILEPETFQQNYDVGFDKEFFPHALDTIDELKAELKSHHLPVSGNKSELIARLMSFDGVYTADCFLDLMKQDYIKSLGDKNIVPAVDYKNMLRSLESLNKHHTAGKLLKDALVEQSFFVEDEFGWVRKCRPDAITKNGQIWIDLKSTTDVSSDGFGRTISKFRYLVQAAWYLDIAKMHYGSDAPKIFAFIAAQKQRPHDIAVHFVTEEQLQFGRIQYQKDYELLRDCMENNIWHGCDGGNVLEVQLPRWDMQIVLDNDNSSY